MVNTVDEPLWEDGWLIGFKREIDDWIRERTGSPQLFYTDNDGKAFLCVKYIASVPLSMIDVPEPWAPYRLEEIRKWAGNPIDLNRVPTYATDGNKIIIDTARMVRLHRNISARSFNRDNAFKPFTINDGIHRCNRAKELNMQSILAEVEECIEFEKNDTYLHFEDYNEQREYIRRS